MTLPDDLEVLSILQEECAEVIQEVSKVRRNGIDELRRTSGASCREHLHRELVDLQLLIDLTHRDYPPPEGFDAKAARAEKIKRLAEWSRIDLEGYV